MLQVKSTGTDTIIFEQQFMYIRASDHWLSSNWNPQVISMIPIQTSRTWKMSCVRGHEQTRSTIVSRVSTACHKFRLLLWTLNFSLRQLDNSRTFGIRSKALLTQERQWHQNHLHLGQYPFEDFEWFLQKLWNKPVDINDLILKAGNLCAVSGTICSLETTVVTGDSGDVVMPSIECRPVFPFLPKYRLGHPENYLFLLSKNRYTGSKYPKINKFNFEKNFNGAGSICSQAHASTRLSELCNVRHIQFSNHK